MLSATARCRYLARTTNGSRFLQTEARRRSWGAQEQEQFLASLKEQLGLATVEDWLAVSRKDVLAAGGRGLLRRYGDSWRRVLHQRFPELGIEEVDCVKAHPRGHWNDLNNCKSFLDSAAAQLGLRRTSDWTTVPRAKLASIGGRGLVAKFGSMEAVLRAVYPDEDWSHAPLPSSHWNKRAHRVQGMAEIGMALGVVKPTDWKNVTRADVQRMGGGPILSRYDSFYDALVDCCLPESTRPEDVLQFRPQAPSGYWDNPRHVRSLLDQARSTYRVKVPRDWYRVSRAQIEALPKGKSLLSRMSLVEALRLAYPSESWNEHALGRSDKRAAQRWLHRVAEDIYEDCDVLEDVRIGNLPESTSDRVLELDVYVPAKKLAFEYQGRHHYEHLPFFGPLEEYSRRDKEKSQLCVDAGIRLVEVPYWWDNEPDSLLGSLFAMDPALVPASLRPSAAGATPIPAQPAKLVNKPIHKRSSRGSLMCPTYDGFRAVWTGTELASITGKRLKAPNWWVNMMPSTELEGELYVRGRPGGGVGLLSSLGRHDSACLWKNVKFHALDIIDASLPLEKRIFRLKGMEENDIIHTSEVELCRDRSHLLKALHSASAAGAAGVVLRDPHSFTRSTSSPLWKERTAFMAEATMVGPSPSSRHLVIEHSGNRQAARCSQQQYDSPPQSGEVVHVVHYGRWGTGRLRYPFLA